MRESSEQRWQPAKVPNPTERLLARLDLDQESPSCFIGGSGPGGAGVGDRLYGGLVAAQAYVAAARTVDIGPVHSLHLYFLRPGRISVPIRFEVEHIKQGRRFQARQVRAMQGDELILQMMASFSDEMVGVEHQDVMPVVPGPESLPNRNEARGRKDWEQQPIDYRTDDPNGERADPDHWMWMRPMQPVVADPVFHTAALVFASDSGLLRAAVMPHRDAGDFVGASLDHTIWFHSPITFDDWHLHTVHSPAARHERGLAFGAVYRSDGSRIATTAQEGAMRFQG